LFYGGYRFHLTEQGYPGSLCQRSCKTASRGYFPDFLRSVLQICLAEKNNQNMGAWHLKLATHPV
jgi:hypothetical protein